MRIRGVVAARRSERTLGRASLQHGRTRPEYRTGNIAEGRVLAHWRQLPDSPGPSAARDK